MLLSILFSDVEIVCINRVTCVILYYISLKLLHIFICIFICKEKHETYKYGTINIKFFESIYSENYTLINLF